MTVTTSLPSGVKNITVPDLTEIGATHVLKQVAGALYENMSAELKQEWTIKSLLLLAASELGD